MRRQIPEALLDRVLTAPDQIVEERDHTKAYQSKLDFGNRRVFLLRAIVAD